MRGEIGAFSVAEILQLIGMQEKSGMLRVRSRGKTAVLFFDSGKVVSARDRRQIARDPFLSYLQEKGAIGIQELNRVAEAKQSEGGDLIDILLGEKVIDEKTLAELLSDYAVQTLESMVKWETGTFEFVASTDGIPEKSIIKPMRLERILMEALRRKDEVEEIRRFLPAFDTKIKIAEPNVEDLPLESHDYAVIKLVDGKRTIDDILEESDAEEVETLDILERLFALGIVSIAEKEAPRQGAPIFLSPLKSLALTALIVGAAALVRFFLLTAAPSTGMPAGTLRVAIEEFIDEREVQNLHFALDAYQSVNGAYPARLEDLVSAKMVSADQIANRYGDIYAYRYFQSEGRYLLSH
jgi:hypothetical protein